MIANEVINALKSVASEERRKSNEWFFKTGKGQYGYGDQFIGVRMPELRKVAKQYHWKISFDGISTLLNSPIHEERLCGLIILVYQYPKGNQRAIYEFYSANFASINNWDLVDTTAPNIVGSYLFDKPNKTEILQNYAHSDDIWTRRIGIVSTFTFIKNNCLEPTLQISQSLLGDKQDLIHKATGWMLREVYKRDATLVKQFLKQNYAQLPRTTLRYAIERMDKQERQDCLKGIFDVPN
ncbi:MAG TPA: DNA alkylation repair protein [Candidatus Thioglobus sp.]|jgi:3-methyladenine DNA glycosylase AlkD|nr:DNA alkylation repair protein [Candidatus Thioglobus sp.]HIL20388.1 DNA alkylation repair protein [Candidatus Thioglobus sp.]